MMFRNSVTRQQPTACASQSLQLVA